VGADHEAVLLKELDDIDSLLCRASPIILPIRLGTHLSLDAYGEKRSTGYRVISGGIHPFAVADSFTDASYLRRLSRLLPTSDV
jgi:hypothetical protein